MPGTANYIFDWTHLASETNPTGFRQGYYAESTGEYTFSYKWLCTDHRTYRFDGYEFIFIVPPTGYTVFVTEYRSTTHLATYGTSSRPGSLLVKVEHNNNYGITLGRFPNNDSQDYNYEEFLNQFKCYVISLNDYVLKYRGRSADLNYTNILTDFQENGWYQIRGQDIPSTTGLPEDYPNGVGCFVEVFSYDDSVENASVFKRWLRLSTFTGQSWINFISSSSPSPEWHRIGASSSYESFQGKKLSILGDSISSMRGYVPDGNDTYYTGSNQGVSGVNQMWWKILCNELGMTPLVIDAWSGSGVCYNYATDSSHADTVKIPMCSDLRTGRLGTNSETPDVIIIAGGTNDWTYSKSTTTPIGDWDGKTTIDRSKVISGTSTFMESYASMIQQLQTNYPNAIIIGTSCFFTCRGTNLGCTHVNDTGHPTSDYNDAIEKVCKIMGVPYLSIYDVGFNFNNYYPTYAEDSQTIATHPNATGHRVIAKRFIDRLPGLVKQFYS